jgi:hypothetical protein
MATCRRNNCAADSSVVSPYQIQAGPQLLPRKKAMRCAYGYIYSGQQRHRAVWQSGTIIAGQHQTEMFATPFTEFQRLRA